MRIFLVSLLVIGCGASTHDEPPARPTERPIARSTVQPAPSTDDTRTATGIDLRDHGLPVFVDVVAPLEVEAVRAPVDLGDSRAEREVVHLRSSDPEHVTQVRLFAVTSEEGERYLADGREHLGQGRVVREIEQGTERGYVVSMSGSETDGPYELRVYDREAGVVCDATSVLTSPPDRLDRAIEACLAIRPAAESSVVER